MADYAYTNARIRAMQGRLFNRAGYESLLAQPTLAGVLDALKRAPHPAAPDSPPGTDLQSAPIIMDEALRQGLALALAKLRRITLNRARDLLGLILLRWDVYNLKTVFRGKRAHAPTEEVLASTLPVGWLDEAALAELTRATTIRATADMLETWRSPLARPFRDGLRALGESDDLQILEFALDRFAFAQALKAVAEDGDDDRVARDYLRLLVDKANFLTALRHLYERSALTTIEAGRHFLDVGGRFTRAHYNAVAGARDARHAMALPADTPIRRLAGALPEGDAPALPRIERALDRALLHAAVGLSHRDPLGIGVAVAYVEQKVNEVRNLRMILRGKASGMGAEQIREWVIV